MDPVLKNLIEEHNVARHALAEARARGCRESIKRALAVFERAESAMKERVAAIAGVRGERVVEPDVAALIAALSDHERKLCKQLKIDEAGYARRKQERARGTP